MRRVAELRDLSDDHHTALVLARRCRRQVAERPTADLWREVQATSALHLEPHFRIEERYLLPALESIGEGDLATRIREDHAALRALRRSDQPTPQILQDFGRLLQEHVRYEERRVFDPTQERLPKAALRAIAQACQEARRARPGSRDC